MMSYTEQLFSQNYCELKWYQWLQLHHKLPLIDSEILLQCMVFHIYSSQTTGVSSPVQEFLRASGIKHVCSSPYHPSTNGLAEKGIQAFKKSMKRLPEGSISRKVSQFWFWYRLTPHSTTGVPPAELLLGRRLRSELDFLK